MVPGGTTPVPRVAVCIATYRRPRLLRALLESLADLRFDEGSPDLRVVLVDNDREGSAREVAGALRARLGVPLHYLVEPRRNIAHARNRGVVAALEEGADWIAFVDDDEIVRPEWLATLLRVQAEYAADAVCGAVRARFEVDVPWVIRSGLLESRPTVTGTPMIGGATNNALVAAHLLAGGGAFDPSFGLTGGSDSHLFLRLHRQGARIVWAEEAVVDEFVPAGRMRLSWLMRRAFRVGNCAVWCERMLEPARARPALRAAKGMARLGLGIAKLIPGVVRGRAGLAEALYSVVYGVGSLTATLGYRYAEYRVPRSDVD